MRAVQARDIRDAGVQADHREAGDRVRLPQRACLAALGCQKIVAGVLVQHNVHGCHASCTSEVQLAETMCAAYKVLLVLYVIELVCHFCLDA